MRLTSRQVTREAKIELSMTSMIDVVFLLLIFFMTTASFVRTERNLKSAIKVERQSMAASQTDFEPAVVEVTTGSAGFVYRLGGRELTSASELEEILDQFENKIDGAVVRVDDLVPFGMAAAAIQACKNARFPVVSYVPIDVPEP